MKLSKTKYFLMPSHCIYIEKPSSMELTGQIIVGVAPYTWQTFGEGPNTGLHKTSVNQANLIMRKNICMQLQAPHTAAELTIKKVPIVSVSWAHYLLLFSKVVQLTNTGKLKISTNRKHFLSFTYSQREGM